jgi:glycosyltransferase involved in cell wall biosynthesis
VVTVSFALPVYNGERHLAATLDSLLAQEFDDFELLISDNGSTDGTPDLVRAYAERESRIVFERHDVNRGAIWNYNHLVARARGRYLKWCGHDDLCAPAYLSRCVAELDGSDAVVAYPRTVLIDDVGGVKRQYDDGLDLREAEPHVRVRKCLRHLGLANAVFGLIRLDVLRATPLFGAYNDSDLVLILDLALAGKIHEIDAALFMRRIHAGQAYQANTTPLAVRRWFDPSSRARFVLPRSRRFVEAARAIARAHLPWGERLRCEAELVRVWGPSHLYHGARELGRVTVDLFSGSER